MKRLIGVLVFFYFSSAMFAQPFFYQFNINGSKKLGEKKLYVNYTVAGDEFRDSFVLSGKRQVLKKALPQPVVASVSINDKATKATTAFLANNPLSLSFKNDQISVYDQKNLQQTYLLLTRNDRVRPRYFPLYGELNEKKDSAGLYKLSLVFDSLRQNDIEIAKTYLATNNKTVLSLLAFMRFASFSSDYATVEPYFEQLTAWAKQSPDGKSIESKIAGAKSVQVNTKAPGFSITSLTGEKVSLNNYSGQYVLIDFWASWCGPCRKEHPALKEIYKDFSNKNLTIISISLDDKRENWEAAVKKDGLPWIQLSELKGFLASSALVYGVQAIPANFLVNPDGTIIAKNSSPEQLKTLLGTLLQK